MQSCWVCKSFSKLAFLPVAAVAAAAARVVAVACMVLVTCFAVAACAGPPDPEPPKVIALITLGGLRADAITTRHHSPPRLRELASEADWAGTGIAASSDPLISLVSLLTGTQPWQHQLLSPEVLRRRPFPTLAALLRQAGYQSSAHVPEYLHTILTSDFDRRFDSIEDPAAAAALGSFGQREFVWFHLPHAELTYGRFDRTESSSRALRRRLLRWADPAVAPPAEERQRILEDYQESLGRLDETLGALLDSLRRGTAGGELLLVVAASHGQEFGERGQILFGNNLGRETIEVPIFLELPADLENRIAAPPADRVALTRLFATLAEAVAVPLAPVHPPSLLRASSRQPILSELYAQNGTNHFSLLDQELQLHWTATFADPDPEYWNAHLTRAGMRRSLSRPPKRIFHRLLAEFDRVPPLSGAPGSVPRLRLERWVDNGTVTVEDPARARVMALELRRRFSRFVDRHRAPAEERRFADVSNRVP